MPRHLARLLVAAVAGLATVPAGANPAAGPALLQEFCGGCHFDGGQEGGVALDRLLAAHPAQGWPPTGTPEQAAWINVWKNLRAGTMPPADESQPTADQRQALVNYVSRDRLGVDPDRPDPGQVVLRRLNRLEYANTVRDLTGIDEAVGDDLPADDTGYGFDTIGEVLSLSPLLLENYLAIAARIGERVAVEASGRKGPDYPGHLRRLFPAGPPPEDEAARPAHLRRTLTRLAERGFRRPVDEPTLSRLVAVAEQAVAASGGSFEKGVAAAVTAVLASPRFLFRVEDDAPREAAEGEPAAESIDEFSLATRLSYFLWSTMPDDELFELARAGKLRADLPRQVERMVKDRRSDAFVRNFVGQWLQTRDVEALPFDVRKVLGVADREQGERIFSADVRRAMREETKLLFAHVLREGLPATDLLVGRQTFLNEPLARFYGVPDVTGREMRLVDLPADSRRGGLLTHGSMLVVTSNPTRTSPIKRGLFILDNLLGTPAPPAPPDVPPLERAEASLGKDATMRQLMERHRSDALCASCHARMDPLGLALERYNAVGQWRGDDAAAVLDTSGRLITGLAHRNGTAGPDGAGDHARAAATFLTGLRPRKTAGADIRAGVSVDQIAAAAIGGETRFSSLDLSCDSSRRSGNCDSGYSCAYQFNLSWRSERQPIAAESNPRLVFERLFGAGKGAERKANLAARQAQRRSILDFVAEDARSLQSRLDPADRRKLDEYLSGLREIERQVARFDAAPPEVPDVDLPAGPPPSYAEHIALMADLMVLAFQTDSTRIATFMLAHDGSNRSFREIGVGDGHHQLSHHQGDPEKLEKIARIDRFYAEQLAAVLGKCRAAREADGSSLLDHSMLVYASGLSDGDRHNHDDLPVILAGRAGGRLAAGRHVKLPGEQPMTNLYLTMLDLAGAPQPSFGDSTGPLDAVRA